MTRRFAAFLALALTAMAPAWGQCVGAAPWMVEKDGHLDWSNIGKLAAEPLPEEHTACDALVRDGLLWIRALLAARREGYDEAKAGKDRP